jgi:hypothetical protein
MEYTTLSENKRIFIFVALTGFIFYTPQFLSEYGRTTHSHLVLRQKKVGAIAPLPLGACMAVAGHPHFLLYGNAVLTA